MPAKSRLSQIEVIFQPDGKRAKFAAGTSVLEAAITLGVDISSLCSGIGKCGKCEVRICQETSGINDLTRTERMLLSKKKIKEGVRLACQTRLYSSSTIVIPPESRTGNQRLQTEGLTVKVETNPIVRKYLIRLPPPTLEDARSDEDRLLDGLFEQYALDNLRIRFNTSKEMPIIIRNAKWNVTATLWKNEILSIEPEASPSGCFGLAVDLGTTKIAGFLMNLATGEVVAVAARMNPQIPFGEDIMSRISRAITNGPESLRKLQAAAVSAINDIVDECCRKTGVKTEEIFEFSVVGNTAMQLLFLGIWPKYIGLSPFPPVLRRGVDVPAANLGLKAHAEANVHYLPVIGGFVGADSVADVLASGMPESQEMTMLIDIGTNTEIHLGNKNLIMADSCASGPAFEGMEIEHGMRASTGAIEKISIDFETGDAFFQTVDNSRPVGLCGSALVDALAELLKAGLIDPGGRFVTESTSSGERLRKRSGCWEYVIAWKNETGIDDDIVLTQKDIRELQKAKAAIHTGAEILMRRMNIKEDDIERLIVAGAFGNYIDPESARTIGMYPEISLDKIVFAGNLAGTGAKLCLISKEMREYAERISRTVKYYELGVDKDFQGEYLKSLFFPNSNLKKYPCTVEMLRKLGRVL